MAPRCYFICNVMYGPFQLKIQPCDLVHLAGDMYESNLNFFSFLYLLRMTGDHSCVSLLCSSVIFVNIHGQWLSWKSSSHTLWKNLKLQFYTFWKDKLNLGCFPRQGPRLYWWKRRMRTRACAVLALEFAMALPLGTWYWTLRQI